MQIILPAITACSAEELISPSISLSEKISFFPSKVPVVTKFLITKNKKLKTRIEELGFEITNYA